MTPRALAAPNVATWNLYFGNSRANIERGIRAIADAGADVIGLQELSEDPKQQFVTDLAKRLDWEATTRNSAITVLVGPRWQLVDQSFLLVHRGGQRWESGTGGDLSIYKGITTVQVRHRLSGQRAVVLNNHIVPAIESGGRLRTRKPPKGGISRIDVYQLQMDALTAEMKRWGNTGVPVAATGDFNLAWGTRAGGDLAARMDKIGAVCNWETLPDVDTHGDRTIDYVWSLNAQVMGQRIPGKFGSDHSAVVVDLAPNVGDYVVDPAKVSSFLWGLNVDDPTNKEIAKQRKPGYPIETGVDIVYIKDPSTGKKYPWLVTEAGYRYRMDYLKPVR